MDLNVGSGEVTFVTMLTSFGFVYWCDIFFSLVRNNTLSFKSESFVLVCEMNMINRYFYSGCEQSRVSVKFYDQTLNWIHDNIFWVIGKHDLMWEMVNDHSPVFEYFFFGHNANFSNKKWDEFTNLGKSILHGRHIDCYLTAYDAAYYHMWLPYSWFCIYSHRHTINPSRYLSTAESSHFEANYLFRKYF